MIQQTTIFDVDKNKQEAGYIGTIMNKLHTNVAIQVHLLLFMYKCKHMGIFLNIHGYTCTYGYMNVYIDTRMYIREQISIFRYEAVHLQTRMYN